ncbi:hypothetical protein GCM10011376_09950 [Nocardioides flavus (ex Wang et al. 2016)]|uniref:Lipoprotein n=1 Tax=Nocardioides flavus (ex Wang et al. 2016) TaxID=2058780 RepID=A0ABQ3HFK8_9ACTN|nr:hypothetical protein [Nocardioides flavus (ex Wang et al. 2016)]GHE16385.1 hypothetical protein GCM10011376_09950 [Nocardioides flavus (ex Wang et al. 2016)]
MSRHLIRPLSARVLPALAASLALVVSGCGADEETAAPQPTATSESSGPAGEQTLALTADGSTTARCAMPSAEVLATFDTAFEGTVTSIDDGTVTLDVDRWYAGDEASTVTVEAPSKVLEDLLLAVDFQEGRTYLVSADGDRVTLCGFTSETTPELEAMYAEAFPG